MIERTTGEPGAAAGRVSHPALAIGVCLAALGAMAATRLWIYPEVVVPLSYSLPLLLTLWHRDLKLHWLMAAGLGVVVLSKMILVLPQEFPDGERVVFLLMQLTTIGVTAGVIHAVVRYRRILSAANAQLAAANAELEASNEELAAREEEILRQNEELQNQAEELEQQMQEVEHQTEELQTQSEELRHLNDELNDREQTLNGLLRLAHAARDEAQLLDEICATAPRLLGPSVSAAALLEAVEGRLEPRATCGLVEEGAYTTSLELDRTLARHVVERDQVAHIQDLRLRPDLAVPRPESGGPFRSVLSAPVHLDGRVVGVLEVYSTTPQEWTPQQVELLRWLTSQSAMAWSAVRLRQSLRSTNDSLESTVAARTGELERTTADLRRLATQLNLAEHRERRRIAQVLHDDLQQLLVAAKMRVQSSGVGDIAAVRQVDELIDRAIRVSRTLTAEISPPVLFDDRFEAAVRWWARRMEEQHRLSVEVQIDPEAQPPTTEWRIFLFSAIGECLFNVVKHAGVSRASVALSRDDGAIRVVIADEGCGFDEGRLEQHADGGTFGLFSIRQRIGLMGGRAAISTRPGGGVRVELVAPLSAEPVPPDRVGGLLPESSPRVADPAAAPEAAPAAATRTIRVVVADDHQMVRDSIAATLQARDLIVVVGQAGDGHQAIELVERHQPDVVLMDISMPRMGGIEATRRITEGCPGVKVVGMSMHEEEEMVAAMREAGAAAYLVKGAPLEQLVATVMRVTDDPASSPAPEASAPEAPAH